MDTLWWSLVGLGTFATSVLVGMWVERNLETRDIGAKLSASMLFILSAAIILGIILDRTIVR